MSECADQRHRMGSISHPQLGTRDVYNDKHFPNDREHEYFLRLHFCPNCGKELKEFYEEDSVMDNMLADKEIKG